LSVEAWRFVLLEAVVEAEEPLEKPALVDDDLVIRFVSGVSGDLGGCTGLTLVLKGLVDLDLCTEEALEPRFPFPLELEMESRSSALPIFSNMARALLNRAWWLSVLETEATTEVLGNSLITGDISLVLDFFRKTTVSLFWNLLAIWETKPSLIGLVGAKTPPPASVDSLCFILFKFSTFFQVFVHSLRNLSISSST